MTIWMDKMTVEEELINQFDSNATIITNETDGDRHKMTIEYTETITIDEFNLGRIDSFLSAISDGNPEIQFDSHNNNLQLTLIADESVYREI